MDGGESRRHHAVGPMTRRDSAAADVANIYGKNRNFERHRHRYEGQHAYKEGSSSNACASQHVADGILRRSSNTRIIPGSSTSIPSRTQSRPFETAPVVLVVRRRARGSEPAGVIRARGLDHIVHAVRGSRRGGGTSRSSRFHRRCAQQASWERYNASSSLMALTSNC